MRGGSPMMFGPYQILDQIGTGGMGAVYRALDTRLGREVAVKVLHQHKNVPGARDRFLREARAVSSLNHPNICMVFDIGEEGDEPYLVMELLRGESLKDRIARAPFTEAEIRDIGMQVALALEAAQERGIVHRDIKPANLFLVPGPQGSVQVKVLDFGLAKLENEVLLRGDDLTRSGATVGTVEYMSPEQARGLDLDVRTDLFSLGAVLYEMATGDVPFRGATSAVVFAELLSASPIPPRNSNSRLTPELDRIICHLLEKDRERRIQAAAELSRLLQASAVSSAPATLHVDEKVLPPSAPAPAASVLRPRNGRTETGVRPLDQSNGVMSPVEQSRPSKVKDPLADAPHAPLRNVVDPSAPRALRKSGSAVKSRFRYVNEEDEEDWPDSDSSSAAETQSQLDEPAAGRHSRTPMVAAVFLAPALVLAGMGYWLMHRHGGADSDIGQGPVLIAGFENRTSDATLDAVPTALRALLQEVPDVAIAGGLPPLQGTAPQPAAAAATRLHATAYLTGTMDRDAGQYRIHAEFRRPEDDAVIASEEVQAQSSAEIPQALDRLALALRTHLGETAEQASATSVPLAMAASSSMEAVGAYGQAMALARAGRIREAAQSLAVVLSQDPQFPLARLQLAELDRMMGDDASATATLAPLAKRNLGGTCQRHRYAYNVSYSTASAALKAAQAWASACPASIAAKRSVAESDMRNGGYAEAERAAAEALKLDPDDRESLRTEAAALIGGNHFEAALRQQQHARARDIASPGMLLAAAYLMNDAQIIAVAEKEASASEDPRDAQLLVAFYANRGELRKADAEAEEMAARAAGEAELLQAQAAAAKAMAGRCAPGASTGERGVRAVVFNDIAAAWCHRPEAIGQNLHEPELQSLGAGLQAWAAGDSARVLSLFQDAHTGAWDTMMVLVRGEAELRSAHQVQSIDDFEAVLSHRGAAFLTGTPAYPLAEAGLQSAYGAMGDRTNSARAGKEFRELWKNADPDLPLLHNAQ